MDCDDDNSLEIQDFTLHRNDFPSTDGSRPSYGLAVYLKDTILSKVRNIKKVVLGEYMFSQYCCWGTSFIDFSVYFSTREKQ